MLESSDLLKYELNYSTFGTTNRQSAGVTKGLELISSNRRRYYPLHESGICNIRNRRHGTSLYLLIKYQSASPALRRAPL